MQFRILGSLEVLDGDREVALGGARQRAVLAILLLHGREVLSVDRLVDELWGERSPDTATKTVQVYVSRLRKELGEGVLLTRGGGYLLDIEPDQVDAARFERLAREGGNALERGDMSEARDLLGGALELWRGPALADLAYEDFAQGEVARLEELRLATLEERIEADLALGRHAEVVPELETLVREHPARERLRAQLMLALYRSGRQADALASYQASRRAFAEELGLEPSRELQELEQAILTHDPAIDAPSRRTRPPDDGRRPRSWALVAVGGALLLLAALTAIVVTGESSPELTRAPANSLALIDPDSNRVVGTVPTGIRPTDVAAGHGNVWVANDADDTVTQVSARGRKVLSTTSPGTTVSGLAVGADGVWISDAGRSRLLRLDEGFRTVARTVRLAPKAEVLGEFGPNPVATGHGSIWAGGTSSTIARVDPATGETSDFAVGNSPIAIATGAGAVWVADDADRTLTRIDPASENAVLETTRLGGSPSAVTVGAGAVWVTNAEEDRVARIDPEDGGVTTTTRVGRRPTGVAVGEGAVWVANSLSGTVSRLDPRTGEVEATVDVGEAPTDLVVADGLVWVTVQQRSAPAPPTRGGVARLVMAADPGPQDPALDTDYQRVVATCGSLYTVREDGTLLPELARAKPAVSRDERTYTFRVRSGFRFSPPSNEPVTARAFERAIERARDPRLGSFGGQILQDLAGVEASGDELVVRLAEPAPDLPARLASNYFCAVPPSTPVTPEGVDGVPTAGPYYVASHVPGRSLVLRRNPGYHGPRRGRLEELRYRIGVPVERAIAAVEADREDVVPLAAPTIGPGAEAPHVRRLTARYGPHSDAARDGRQRLFTGPAPNVYWFAFNTRRPLFADVRLRKAVNYAMDRRALAAHTGGGEIGRPTDQMIPPGLPGFEDAGIFPLGGPDLATARRLAGGAERRAVLYTCNLPGCSRHAQILRSNLRAIGIELDVRQFSIAEMFTRLNEGRDEPFDIAYYNWFYDNADPANYINLPLGPGGPNIRPFEDPELDRRMAGAARLTGRARYSAYAELDRDISSRFAAVAPFATGTSSYFLSKRMGCVRLHPIYGLDLTRLCLRG
ncbi:MAG TPA: BTAD domain-containing putative transcriptional regulator [Thermoleophilaceae bacterium]|nr:BTAD domain-containing putative transcriptional regulator [Thermoleophilaceae bacterium]